jgi:cell division protein FtsB
VSYNRTLSFVVKAKDQVLPSRDDATRSEPRTRIKAWALGTAIALIALSVGSVFGDRGILNLVGKRRQVEALRGELEGLRAENARLSSEIAALRTSPRAIERLAREQLGLARPDETVFLIREEDASARR